MRRLDLDVLGADGASVDFVGLARASGFRSIFRFSDAVEWRESVARVLATEGPNFVLLDVSPVPGAVGPRSPGPAAARARALRDRLRQPPA